MKRKPVIGLIPLVDEKKDNSYWMLPGYMEGILEAGGLPVMLPLTQVPELLAQMARDCDGFLLTGGHDVSPGLYHQAPLPASGPFCPERDRMESLLLPAILAADKPLLGICRGIQFLNACLGGSLWQDLPAQHPSAVCHHQTPPYDKVAHLVVLEPSSPLRQLLGMERLPVNSYHHQGVRALAPGLSVMARAEDGLVEGVWMPGKRFVWAVQWHPEFSHKTDENSRKIFRALVEAAAQ